MSQLRLHSHIHQSYSSRFFPALYKCFRAHFPIWKVLLHTASKRFSSSTATSLQSLGAVGNLLCFSACAHTNFHISTKKICKHLTWCWTRPKAHLSLSKGIKAKQSYSQKQRESLTCQTQLLIPKQNKHFQVIAKQQTFLSYLSDFMELTRSLALRSSSSCRRFVMCDGYNSWPTLIHVFLPTRRCRIDCPRWQQRWASTSWGWDALEQAIGLWY